MHMLQIFNEFAWFRARGNFDGVKKDQIKLKRVFRFSGKFEPFFRDVKLIPLYFKRSSRFLPP